VVTLLLFLPNFSTSALVHKIYLLKTNKKWDAPILNCLNGIFSFIPSCGYLLYWKYPQNSVVLEFAYNFKEELRQIYESNLTVKAGFVKMKKWLKHARIFFLSIAAPLEKHLPEIANYFLNRTTSGVTEGINTRIKLILRQSYGFVSFKSMREKLLACIFK
jgi:hypothetical protein